MSLIYKNNLKEGFNYLCEKTFFNSYSMPALNMNYRHNAFSRNRCTNFSQTIQDWENRIKKEHRKNIVKWSGWFIHFCTK